DRRDDTGFGWGYFGGVHQGGADLVRRHRQVVDQDLAGWGANAGEVPGGLKNAVKDELMRFMDERSDQDAMQILVNGGHVMDITVLGGGGDPAPVWWRRWWRRLVVGWRRLWGWATGRRAPAAPVTYR